MSPSDPLVCRSVISCNVVGLRERAYEEGGRATTMVDGMQAFKACGQGCIRPRHAICASSDVMGYAVRVGDDA